MPVESDALVGERMFEFPWSGGFALTQKQKNVKALHEAACEADVTPVLEVSTKSQEQIGMQLSAFNLILETVHGSVPVEVAFQASKVYEHGGPFDDMYGYSPRDARRDPRHGSSGALIGFEYLEERWPLDTGTLFYDWLYMRALRDFDTSRDLSDYAGFTDIEFNPKKSLNCQARSCALFVSLTRRGLVDDALRDTATLRMLTTQYVRMTMVRNESVPTTDDRSQLGWTL